MGALLLTAQRPVLSSQQLAAAVQCLVCICTFCPSIGLPRCRETVYCGTLSAPFSATFEICLHESCGEITNKVSDTSILNYDQPPFLVKGLLPQGDLMIARGDSEDVPCDGPAYAPDRGIELIQHFALPIRTLLLLGENKYLAVLRAASNDVRGEPRAWCPSHVSHPVFMLLLQRLLCFPLSLRCLPETESVRNYLANLSSKITHYLQIFTE
jgi:hypothetical protein